MPVWGLGGASPRFLARLTAFGAHATAPAAVPFPSLDSRAGKKRGTELAMSGEEEFKLTFSHQHDRVLVTGEAVLDQGHVPISKAV